jgi:tetratricopeptide (TPR) repeat protein
MKRLNMLAVALVCVVGLWGGSCLGAESLKQLSSGGITVSYPDGLDAQAKKVMTIAQATIKPSIEVHRQAVALLSDVDSMSTDITQALGADEKRELAKTRLQSFKDKSTALIASFANIKLVRKANAIATDGIDAGLMQVRYTKDKDEFNMVFDESDTSADKLKRSFFPVLINGDGTIRSEGKLGQMALDFLGSGEPMAIAPVQDTISYLIAEPLRVYYPFTRWFNEGVSGYLTRQMVAKYGSKQLNTLAATLFTVNANTQEFKSKVNLLSWAQSPYENKNSASFDPALDAARTQYAIEAISGLLATAGPKALPKIMNGVSYAGNPDTDAICAAIQKATGTDFKPKLMSYVPKDVRDGIASGQAAKLITTAEGLAGEKKWTDAAAALRQALEMTPQDANARLNLAWIEREFGERKDSELQVFLTAGVLKQQKHAFHLFAFSIEGNYISGRLAILMGNLEAAKEFLQPVLQLRPDHADAKRAMEDIHKLEDTAKGTK